MNNRPNWLRLSDEVRDALEGGRAIVALESTVLAHGLPRPRNLEIGLELEAVVRATGAVPATVAVIDGNPTVGLRGDEIERIATDAAVDKLSTRDLPVAMAGHATGATTVAATASLAHRAGIYVVATGGIGGVHRGQLPDISADLTELQRTPIIVVCAGAKSILDLPATRELLETLGVLVLGWITDRFPAFYVRDSDLAVDARVDDAARVADIWIAHQRIGSPSAVLLCAPVPVGFDLPYHPTEERIERALGRAEAAGIRGKEVTPYLLRVIASLPGESVAAERSALDANVALLRNNAEIAATVAAEISSR